MIRTIKEEEVQLTEYQDFAEAYAQIGQFLEEVYQRKRIHSALGYLTPAEFEAAWRQPPVREDFCLKTGYNLSNFRGAVHTVTVGPSVIDVTPPVVSNNKAPQSVQYSDPITTVTITATYAHSPGSSLSASASFTKNGGPSQSGLPSGLTLNAASNNGSTVPGEATWTVSGNIQAAPGTYTIKVTVTDNVGNSGFTTFTIIVTPEDARADYIGTTFASTACATCSTATVALAATIRDITAVDPSLSPPNPDSYAGNISNATVRFINRGNNNTLCTATVGVVPPGTTTGTATCNWRHRL